MGFLRDLEYYRNRFHPKQVQAWLAYKGGKNLFLAWSRRSGKSQLFTEVMVEDVEECGHDCLYVAKTQKQARRIIWKKFAQVLRGQSGWALNESRLEAVYKGGPLISVKGADLSADNLAGSAYRLIVCDEYALWRKPGIVKEILAPMLADHEGQMLYGSTKRGKNHFYDLHQLALSDSKKYYVSECTLYDNTFMTEKGREIVLSEYSGEKDPLYQQEIMNQYVSFEGMAFALPENEYITKRWDPADLEHSYHWRGMDHGYSPDPTAMVWIAYNRKFKYYLVYSDYKEKQLLIYDHAKKIKEQEPYEIIDTFSDIDPQLIAEYGAVGLSLTMANKTNKDAKILRLVNHLRTGQLKIASCCKQLLKEMQSYEWGQDGDDHLCFVAGTLITTRRGPVPIESITMEDQVLTRFGWNPVRAYGVTGVERTISLEFSNGSKLSCTPNHPIYTHNRGFIRADALTYEDNVCSSNVWVEKKRSNLKDSYLDGILTLKGHRFADILCATRVILKKASGIYTVRFGKILMDLFLMDGMSITKTETALTTTFPIWNVFPQRSIGTNIKKTALLEVTARNSWLISKKSEPLQKIGMRLKQALTGIRNMAKRSSRIGLKLRLPVSYVVGLLRLGTLAKTGLSFVRQNVRLKSEEIRALMTKHDRVSSVRPNLESTNTIKKLPPALDRVGLLSVGTHAEEVKVYNLSVENNHEYFANGILVSNCDALNYGYNNLTLPPETEKKKVTLPRHTYKKSVHNNHQSFGEESQHNDSNSIYDDIDY